MKLTGISKTILTLVVVGGLYFGFTTGVQKGWIPTPGIMKSLTVEKVTLPPLKEALVQNVTPVALPSSTPADVQSVRIRGEIWEWNSQMGMLLANGGAVTMKGSIMESHGVNLSLERQDDTNKMQQDLISCANELAGGATQCSGGANFVIIMGDGAGQFIAAVNPQLTKLGPQYKMIVIGSNGYSRGEDKFMASPEVKADKNKAKGILVAGVLRDGDWNIALNWAGANGIKNNPDEKTWDPDAINWVNTTDYLVAAEVYNSKKCEDRKVIKDGKLTGEVKKVCVNAVVTWTPGDVNIVKNRGGLVNIASSKEYRSQMPAVILGPKAFFDANKNVIQHMLAAIFEGGDQVKAFDKSLRKAAQISAEVYKDQDADYWYKYFKGVTERDSDGNEIELGGSAVNNLQDNMLLFGIASGSNDNFRSTYTMFANIAVSQYPNIFKDTPIPEAREVEDKSFIVGASAVISEAGSEADAPTFKVMPKPSEGRVLGKKSININFDVGKATLTPEGVRQMTELKDSLVLNALFVRIDGYTDNTGNENTVNKPLSLARAQSVKAFLQRSSPKSFPESRFAVAGHGSEEAVQSNATSEGRAANRRVLITQISE